MAMVFRGLVWESLWPGGGRGRGNELINEFNPYSFKDSSFRDGGGVEAPGESELANLRLPPAFWDLTGQQPFNSELQDVGK